MEINFAQLQEQLIAGDLGVLEGERKAYVKRFWIGFFICFGLLIAVLGACFQSMLLKVLRLVPASVPLQ